MLWTLIVILFLLWLLGFFLARVGGPFIHLLLAVALIGVLYQFVSGHPI
jgi:hypothetical protein